MSTNCIDCGENQRDGLDLLCSACRDKRMYWTGPDIDKMTREEVKAELDRLRIDIEPALARVREALERKQADDALRAILARCDENRK